MNNYDIAVIGGGSAGLTVAYTAIALKKKVLIIEKDRLGGECTWTGCVPSKALLKAAKVAYQSQNASKYGIINDCNVDLSGVMNYVHNVQEEIYQKESPEVLRADGIDVLNEKAEFIDCNTLKLNQDKIKADKIIVATGSSPVVPPIDGIKDVSYLTNQTLFSLEKLPESLLIIGGGPIGVEMAQALNRLGVKIKLVQRSNSILIKEEPALSEALADKLRQEGVELLTGYEAIKIKEEDQIILTVSNRKAEKELKAEKVLIAAGRKANITGVNPDRVGIETGRQGIITNNKMQTNISNIYACGDVVGPYRFSHISYHEGITAAINAILPFPFKKMDYDNILWVTYTDPELAHLGLTEKEARARYGDSIKVYNLDYSELDRAMTDAEEGQAKFICDKSGKLLGAHIIGARAGEIIHSCQIVKTMGIPFKKLQSVIHSYPTYAELIRDGARMAFVGDWENRFDLINKLAWWK